jgi:hypothetical protein
MGKHCGWREDSGSIDPPSAEQHSIPELSAKQILRGKVTYALLTDEDFLHKTKVGDNVRS